ncbi:MAG: VWA domain-containing protein [Candidatus Riflebacteria bacterium]|nr:VWA domain-containing protein [Candidatus Riflebacteria bacterium]
MRWNSPEFMLLLLLIPLIAIYRLYISRTTKKGGLRFPLTFLAGETRSLRSRLLILPDLMRLLVLVLLVFALMQPQYGQERETVNRQGIDIMLAIDVSSSMAAEDFKPNRLKAAQKITENFIVGIQDHRIGLVVFAGLALTQCPLTVDYGVVTELLRRTSLNMLKYDGTAIGDAIINAVYKFAPERKDKRDRVVILLSDGENNSGIDPLEAARVAAEKKIRVYTIGVGSLEGAPIPIIQGGRKMYARTRDGSLYVPKIDEQLLKDIAFMTSGQYFRATDNTALEEIYKTIATLEKGKLDVSRTIQYSERFYWFLAPAFALLVLEVYLRSRVFQRLF